MEIKFDTETIRLITLFESLTDAPVKDCLIDNENNTIYFIINEGKVGIAIGKNGCSVRRAEKIIGKNIKVFEFSKDLSVFLKNLIPQTNEIKIRNESEKIIVEIKVDKNSKALVIGRDGKRIRLFKELIQRNHSVDELIIR